MPTGISNVAIANWNAEVQKSNNLVNLLVEAEGTYTRVSGYTRLFNLPETYRPKRNIYINGIATGGGDVYPMIYQIKSNGDFGIYGIDIDATVRFIAVSITYPAA